MMRLWCSSYVDDLRRCDALAQHGARGRDRAAGCSPRCRRRQVARGQHRESHLLHPAAGQGAGGNRRHEVGPLRQPRGQRARRGGPGPARCGNAKPTPVDGQVGRLQRDTVLDPAPVTAPPSPPPGTRTPSSPCSTSTPRSFARRTARRRRIRSSCSRRTSPATVSAQYVVDTTGLRGHGVVRGDQGDEPGIHRRRPRRPTVHAIRAGEDRPVQGPAAGPADVHVQDHRRSPVAAPRREKALAKTADRARIPIE